MEIWHAIILGLVQGLTEFLPVSSSGHIAFFQSVFGISGDGATFYSLILHLGTLVAVCIVFRKQILALFKKPFKTLGYLVIATIPAGLTGLIFEYFDVSDALLEHYKGIVLAVCFLLTAAMLFITELVARRQKEGLPLKADTAIAMGFMQAVAVIPGISRSGSTIFAGTVMGCKREEVASFSFIMSVPVILGGFLVELLLKLKSGELVADLTAGDGVTYGVCIAVGFIVSAIAGLFAIKVMLKIIKKADYKWFSLYLVLLSITCIILQFTYFKA